MRCPHCLAEFHDHPLERHIDYDADGGWSFVVRKCPSGDRLVIELDCKGDLSYPILVHPKTPNRAPLPPEVPTEFAADYIEACLVLTDSAKASAALSRRCLQHILREKAGVKKGNLVDEIQEVIDSGKLPSHLSESLDAVRNTGNFAAHPIKSKSSGELVEVEPGEAEWNLDVIEGLFDFFFVQPEALKRKKNALNQKLADAGKPPMK